MGTAHPGRPPGGEGWAGPTGAGSAFAVPGPVVRGVDDGTGSGGATVGAGESPVASWRRASTTGRSSSEENPGVGHAVVVGGAEVVGPRSEPGPWAAAAAAPRPVKTVTMTATRRPAVTMPPAARRSRTSRLGPPALRLDVAPLIADSPTLLLLVRFQGRRDRFLPYRRVVAERGGAHQ